MKTVKSYSLFFYIVLFTVVMIFDGIIGGLLGYKVGLVFHFGVTLGKLARQVTLG